MANFCPCILPFWGILMFIIRPDLWKYMALPLVVSIAVTIGLLVALFSPAVEEWQTDFLIDFAGEHNKEMLGHNATEYFNEDNRQNIRTGLKIVAPIEAALICYLVFQLLFGKVAGKIAMQVLEERQALQAFKERHHLVELQEASRGAMGAGFMVLSLVLLLATMSLNFIPVIGQILFAFSNGWAFAWAALTDLLPIIGFNSCGNQLKHVLCHPFSYLMFGAVCFMINIIPFVGVLCTGGIAYGTALLFEGFLAEDWLGPEFEDGDPSIEAPGEKVPLRPAAAPAPQGPSRPAAAVAPQAPAPQGPAAGAGAPPASAAGSGAATWAAKAKEAVRPLMQDARVQQVGASVAQGVQRVAQHQQVQRVVQSVGR